MADELTKVNFVEQVAERTGSSKADAKRIVEASLEVIQETLIEGGQVNFTGFGSFKTTERKERNGHNPQTGEKMVIPAAKIPKFTPGKGLKDAVKGA